MPLRDHVKQFTKTRKIRPTGWAVTETSTVLMIRAIGRQDQAVALSEHLQNRGMVTTVSMGSKHGETWARLPTAGRAR